MRIIQFGSTGALVLWEKQIKHLLIYVIDVGSNFFFFCRQVHNSIWLVLHHSDFFVSLISTQSSIVGFTSFESIFQTSSFLEVL